MQHSDHKGMRGHVQGGWQNRVLARLANEMSRYNPIHYVPSIKAPVLMVATTQDTLCALHVARRAAALNPLVTLVEKDAGGPPAPDPALLSHAMLTCMPSGAHVPTQILNGGGEGRWWAACPTPCTSASTHGLMHAIFECMPS